MEFVIDITFLLLRKSFENMIRNTNNKNDPRMTFALSRSAPEENGHRMILLPKRRLENIRKTYFEPDSSSLFLSRRRQK